MDLLIAANTVTQAQADKAPTSGTPGWATDGNPATGLLATDAPAWHYNMMMSELIAIIKAAGFTPSNADWSQVLKAMQTIFAPAQYGVAPYSESLAQLIGGYPLNAVVADPITPGTFWVSTAAANVSVPGATGATWQSLFNGYLTQTISDERYVQKTSISNTEVDFTPNYAGVNRSSGEIWLQYKDDNGDIKYAFAQVPGDYATNTELDAEIKRSQTTENLIKSAFRFGNATSATTLTVPAGVTGLEIREAVGGGGGGAGCQASTASGQFMGAGGAAGSVVRGYYYVNPGDTIVLTPGAGGAGATGAALNAPSNGGTTYVSRNGTVIVTASGGQGGYWADTISSVGGVPLGASGAAGTYEAVQGGAGQDGQFKNITLGGSGASGPGGGAGHSGSTGGTAGASYGAGGGGAFDPDYSGTAYSGGAGFQGRILWRWMPVEGG